MKRTPVLIAVAALLASSAVPQGVGTLAAASDLARSAIPSVPFVANQPGLAFPVRSLSISSYDPLSITYFSCEYYGNLGHYCSAYGTGGTGMGYDVTWTLAEELYDNEQGWGEALFQCPAFQWLGSYYQIGVTITDSSNQSASSYLWIWCPGMN